jgi:ferredoxin-type protein NapH
MSANLTPYVEARAKKGFWQSHRFGITRRLAQLGFLMFFVGGPLGYHWIAKGTLASSMTFGVLPLTDPFVLAQSLAAWHWPEMTALIGAAIVLGGYWLFGGRSFCSWVCPVNPVADLAAWTRRKLGITWSAKLRPEWRRYILLAALAVSAVSGVVAWELVNPVTAWHRALVFGLWFGAVPVVTIFLFDLLVARHGWCGHLCPVGAAYGVIGQATLLRVSAANRKACDDCMDCFAVCPEPHVIGPALRGDKTGATPVITARDCTVCGACVDVCPEQVFRFTHRFDDRVAPAPHCTVPAALPALAVPLSSARERIPS